jgi:hypothetical protein
MCRGWHRLWPGLRRHRRLQPLIRLCCALWQVTLLLLWQVSLLMVVVLLVLLVVVVLLLLLLLLLLCCTCLRLLPCISRDQTLHIVAKASTKN